MRLTPDQALSTQIWHPVVLPGGEKQGCVEGEQEEKRQSEKEGSPGDTPDNRMEELKLGLP